MSECDRKKQQFLACVIRLAETEELLLVMTQFRLETVIRVNVGALGAPWVG